MLISLLFVVQNESEDKNVIEESGSKAADVADKSEDIRFNPNVFTEFKLAGSPEVIIFADDIYALCYFYLQQVEKYAQNVF